MIFDDEDGLFDRHNSYRRGWRIIMEGNYDSFTNFRANIIDEIWKYAKENGLDINATLKNVAETIILVAAIGSFDKYEG